MHKEFGLWVSEKTEGLIYTALYLIKILLIHENNLAFWSSQKILKLLSAMYESSFANKICQSLP